MPLVIPLSQWTWAKNKWLRIFLAFAIFLAFVVVIEGRAYIIHKDHYDMGANWTPEILSRDNTIALWTYQLVIFTLALIHWNIGAFIFMELFWVTCTHDIIGFYGVWGHWAFPSGNWDWMPLYPYLGTWTTEMQLTLSTGALLSSGLLFAFSIKRRRRM